jgi:hypothetical protein
VSDELSRDVPCDDEGCPTVLAGPADPDLCDDCAEAFEQQGIPTSNEQLSIEDEGEAA